MPPYLAGREGELGAFTHMAERIRDGQAENILVYGPRGTGKTVLMNAFDRMCADNDLLPVSKGQFSKKHCDPAAFAQSLQYRVKSGVETFSRLERARQEFMASVKLTRPKAAGAPGLMYYEPPYDPRGPVPYENHLQSYLVKNWEIIEKSEYRGAVLLFDEFHTVLDVPRRSWYVLSDFVGALAEVQAQGCGYAAVLSGLPALKPRVHEARSYSERMFRTLSVGNLRPADAQRALAEPLRGSKYAFSPDLIEQAARDTGGYPYFLQFFGHEIIRRATRARITLDDYQRIRGAIVAQLYADFYDPRFDALSLGQRRVLAAMSRVDGGAASVSDIAPMAGIGRASLERHLVRLEEQSMVYGHGRGTYRLSLPLMQEYLRRRNSAG